MKSRRIIVAAATVATLALASCSTGESTGDSDAVSKSDTGGLPETVSAGDARDQLLGSLEGKKIAYVPISMQIDLTKTWDTEFALTFPQMGATYESFDPANDIEQQGRMIDSAINDGFDVILIQNPDVGVYSQAVIEAHKQGIYVIGLNVQGSQSADAFVGADYHAMAEALANRMVSDCKASGKTKVAVVSGFGTDSISVTSDAGWLPVFKEAGIEVVSNQQGNFDANKSNEVAAAVLQQHPDLCGFVNVFDLAALGVAQAVDAAGLKGEVGIYNIDASKTWCDALQAGDVTAGVSYNASGIAVAAAYQAQALLLRGNPAGTERLMGFVPSTVVDKTNIDQIPGACYGPSSAE